MNSETLECPKCSGSMVEGFVLDRGDLEARHPASWVEGIPEKSLWLGTRIEGREIFRISSFRCTRCGYLESYARTGPSDPERSRSRR